MKGYYRRWISFAIRWMIAAVLVWHAGQKLWIVISRADLKENPIVPEHSVLEYWTQQIPNFLPLLLTVECGIAIWLISGKLKRSALIATILIFAAFTAVLSYEIIQEDPRPCGCSKEERLANAQEVKKQLAWQIALDTGVIAAATWGIFLSRKPLRRRIHLRGGSASLRG